MTTSPQAGARRWAMPAIALVVVVAAGAFAGWWWVRHRSAPDMVAVLTANSRGVGHMEQFQYEKAAAEFEKVQKLAPDWTPGRINLGIALLNVHTDAALARAAKIFEQVLQQEPDNIHARYCLGMILEYKGKPEAALPHFEKVTALDPNDAHAWYHVAKALGDSQTDQADKQARDRVKQCLEKSRQLNPYLTSATYNLAMLYRQEDGSMTDRLLKDSTALRDADSNDPCAMNYTEMGPYAEVIGRVSERAGRAAARPLPLFARQDGLQVKLRPGARWAAAADFAKDARAQVQARVRARFGGTIVVLDYNRDGKPDVLLLGAVVVKERIGDVLLRNDGNLQFTDATEEAGLGGTRTSLGCCAADFDNDGFPDLCITGAGEQHLFRNNGVGRFEDVSARAGLDQVKAVCLGVSFVDLDQDGDLDLVLAQYGTVAEAAALDSGKPPAGAGLAVFLNNGEAPPTAKGDAAALKTSFRRATEPAGLLGEAAPTVNFASSDLDLDRDVDLLVLADAKPATVVLNDRLLRFHRAALPESLLPPGRWNGALVLDADRDERSDLFVVGPGQRPILLVRLPGERQQQAAAWFRTGDVKSPPLVQARIADIDLDGWTDVVGLSEKRLPVLLHNRGGQLVQADEALGRDADWPKDLAGLAVADFSGEGRPDLLLWSETAGLALHRNLGNGNHSLPVEVTGKRNKGEKSRCNADGLGACVAAQAGDLWTGAEITTLAAGLGQSTGPLLLGLGKYTQADVVRIRWPDNVRQAEPDLPVGQVARIEEKNRMPSSCPVLFTWDGERFVFVTDFLGAGSMGELQPDGTCRPPRPQESVKIEAGQLVPRDGRFVLKVAEPMDEATYLDRLQLIVLDHPADVRVYPDERFAGSGPPPSQDLLAFRKEIFPVSARDHRGRDVTAALRAWDRRTVDDFARRSWLGYAEEHWVELDFGDRLAAFAPKDPLILCLAGWTDYPYPESIWAATQAGVSLQPPVLDRLGDDGAWHTLIADADFPAGLPRLMTVDATGKLAGPRCKLRLRTNMDVYWDQVFIAPLLERRPSTVQAAGGSANFRATFLDVAAATLAVRGCAQEFSPDGRKPVLYDGQRTEPVPVMRAAGKLTRTGPVAELLRDVDDCFVVFGPGDEVTAEFDARGLPALPPGWKRSFVLRTWGYCKDAGVFTATGDTIEPLPFRGMSKYPYSGAETYPRDRLHQEYRVRFNTRRVGAERN